MKRILISSLAALVLASGFSVTASAFSAPSVSAVSAVVIDAEDGGTLYSLNADKTMLIASTTKIMTALVVLENRDISETVTVKREWTGIEGSSMYLTEGESLTVEELLYGLMLSSGNDVAVALACSTAGSIEAFADMMNGRAASLGLAGTSFRNPHGFNDDGHYSTARDMAALTREAMRNEIFVRIVSTKTAVVAGRYLTNHNRLLSEYEGTIGVKTGYTKDAGRILVSCAERNGLRLICVTMDDGNDWADHKALYDAAFASYRRERAIPDALAEIYIPVISGEKNRVRVIPREVPTVLCREGDSLRCVIEAPEFVYAGVREGNTAGRAVIYKNGEQVQTVPLYYGESVIRDSALLLTLPEKLMRLLR